jgi:hypothetical protein
MRTSFRKAAVGLFRAAECMAMFQNTLLRVLARSVERIVDGRT